MRKKLTVLNATAGIGPASHGLAENKRTIDPRFSDRIFLLLVNGYVPCVLLILCRWFVCYEK